MNLRALVDRVDQARDPGDSWCLPEKAHALAAIVAATRPALICEIGVWRGASLIPQLLALQMIGAGRAIAIDPWDIAASVDGEERANVEWWKTIDHERAYQDFLGRVRGLGLAPICEVWRKRSDDCDPPQGIGLMHIDGNHTEQAYRDVARYAPHVLRGGGFMVLDDIGWSSGGVGRAHELAKQLGFVDRYPIGTGIVMTRS